MYSNFRRNILTGISIAYLIGVPSFAHGQNVNAASGQAFGNLISPSNNPTSLPSNGTGGTIVVPGGNGNAGSTITAADLTPSQGANSNLSSLANSNAGITGAANTSATNANTDQTQWGSAYRTLHGSHLLDPHKDMSNDPIWDQTDATFTNVFANNFSGCTQTLGSPSVVVPPTSHSYNCLQTTNANLQCSVTHTLGTNVVPAAQRCDPATFVTQKLTVYDNTPTMPNQIVTDNISCDANGMLQHNLHSTLVTPTPSTCTKTAPYNTICSVTHDYYATKSGGRIGGTQPQSSVYLGWIAGSSNNVLKVTPITGSASSTTMKFKVQLMFGYVGLCNANSSTTFNLPMASGSKLGPVNLSTYGSWSCWSQYMRASAVSNGCTGNTCTATFNAETLQAGTLTYIPGCRGGSKNGCNRQNRKSRWVRGPDYWAAHEFTATYTKPSNVITDNGWSDTIAGSGCKAKADANPAGTAPLSFACANDPSGGGSSWNSPTGVIKQSDMVSPYTGISSLCKEMQVTETIPSVDGCAATKADPLCTFVSSKILPNGDTEFTYSCNKTTTATTVLSNCSNGACSANL